jgi:hypothetical protein
MAVFVVVAVTVCGCNENEVGSPALGQPNLSLGDTAVLDRYVLVNQSRSHSGSISLDISDNGEPDVEIDFSWLAGNFYDNFSAAMRVSDNTAIRFYDDTASTNIGAFQDDQIIDCQSLDELYQLQPPSLIMSYGYSSYPEEINDSTTVWHTQSNIGGEWYDENQKFAVFTFIEGENLGVGWIRMSGGYRFITVHDYGYKLYDNCQ